MQYLLILIATTLSLSSAAPVPSAALGTLELEVDNIRAQKGTIWVGLYRSADDFLDRDRAVLQAATVNQSGTLTITVPNMMEGHDYAIAIFHDLNDNGELDTNWLGLPSEPWAFSGEPRTRFRLPYFDEVKFRFNQYRNKQELILRKW